MDEGITAEQHAANVERFTELLTANNESALRLKRYDFTLPQPLVLLERLELLIESAFGRMTRGDVEGAAPERLVFECRWQERMAGLYARAEAEAAGSKLIVPKGMKMPPTNGS
jgi:hypothetical protein